MSTDDTQDAYFEALKRPLREWSDMDLTDLAAQVALAMMQSASTDKVRPRDWWDRCQSAMEVAADRAESWPEFVSVAAAKLQVAALRASTANFLSTFERDHMREQPDFERFRAFTARNAVYVVAIARGMREAEREARGVARG